MKSVEASIRKHLSSIDARTMQLATAINNQPWICTVYFVIDDDLNIYWLSLSSRRHSREIAENNKVAATIPIKQDQPVIGVQVEGKAEEATDKPTIASVMKRYVTKYKVGDKFYDRLNEGKNQHHVYRLKPSVLVLFDELNFKDRGRIEWNIVEKRGL